MKPLFTAVFLLLGFYANAAGKPVKPKIQIPYANSESLIIFYKPDCPYCQNMNRVLDKEGGFVRLLENNFSVQKVNIETEEGRALADRFNVHAVPSIIRYNAVSGENSMIKGFPGIQKLAAILNLDYLPVVQAPLAVQGETNIISPVLVSTTTVPAGKVMVGCGDGIIQAGEQCDDGNVVNGDGCSSTCQVQTGYSCSGTPSVCTTICGDGIKVGAEQCDDGNVVNGDGCSSTCTVQPGYFCSGSPSVCSTVCGDGIVAGPETCDDGNNTNGDGCSATCNTESGYSCSGVPSVCTQLNPNDDCGGAVVLTGSNGTVSGNNTTATISAGTPGCLADRDLWYKFTLASPVTVQIYLNGVSMLDPYLGLYSGSCGSLSVIVCDDDSGPGLNSLITTALAAGTYYIKAASFGTTNSGSFNLVYNFTGEVCGNGFTGVGEECDDGNVNDGDGCSSLCKFENSAAVKGVSINRDGVRADPSSMLDVKSTESGILIPRMSSTQRTAIASPAKGLLVFDITTNTFWYYKTVWVEINGAAGTGFGVINSNTVAFNTAANYTPAWPTESYDDGNNFASNNFTAPQAGVYQFTATYTINTSAASVAFSLIADIRSLGPIIYAANTIINPIGSTGITTVNVTGMAKLTAGTVIYTTLTKSAASTSNITGSTFNGYRVY